jgi:hypothetical protein
MMIPEDIRERAQALTGGVDLLIGDFEEDDRFGEYNYLLYKALYSQAWYDIGVYSIFVNALQDPQKMFHRAVSEWWRNSVHGTDDEYAEEMLCLIPLEFLGVGQTDYTLASNAICILHEPIEKEEGRRIKSVVLYFGPDYWSFRGEFEDIGTVISQD